MIGNKDCDGILRCWNCPAENWCDVGECFHCGAGLAKQAHLDCWNDDLSDSLGLKVQAEIESIERHLDG